jgi:hypothetical protein
MYEVPHGLPAKKRLRLLNDGGLEKLTPDRPESTIIARKGTMTCSHERNETVRADDAPLEGDQLSQERRNHAMQNSVSCHAP